MRFLPLLFIFTIFWSSCSNKETENEKNNDHSPFYTTAKPALRWWWFATEIKPADIKYQLDWIKEKNFGGVEIAWVYPLHRYQRMYARKYNRHYSVDTSAHKWLSQEWVNSVAYTKRYADSIGLFCDFTFGSAWPVAAHNIGADLSTKIYGDSSFRQTLTFAWSWPDTLLVIDHLNKAAFERFAKPIAKALEDPLKGGQSALFTDSWEIKLNDKYKIWTDGFENLFQDRFGYDIIPYMERGIDSFPDVRYDYMMLLDSMVRNNFYKPYVEKCRELGAISRVQCLASPTNVMTTYSMVDVPETESMLNNPNYSLIVSSAAALSSKPIVSSETFTCMYGFPATYLREEQVADLKLVADAMFAKGVNQHFYHGLPYNPKGVDSIDFFATTYFGPGGSLAPQLKEFNGYMQRVSQLMRQGKTFSDVAVYIPFEDGIMKGAYPKERQRVWVWGEYEMRYIDVAEETKGYHPLWINQHFLELAKWKGNRLIIGDASFSSLYVDVKYLDQKALKRILVLAKEGLPICLKQSPKQAGYNKVQDFDEMLEELNQLSNVRENLTAVIGHKALIEGDSLPAYWAREQRDGSLIIFLAQSKAKDLEYPLYSGQSAMEQSVWRELIINYAGNSISKRIEFKPYQSVALQIFEDGRFQLLDIEYVPEDPLIRPREPQKSYF